MPKVIVAADKSASTVGQAARPSGIAASRKRRRPAKAATFGTTETKPEAGAVPPWNTSGAQTWNGTSVISKP